MGPEQLTKAKTDASAGREAMDAAKRLFDNRTQLFKEGALAKKLVDEAEVAYAQARANYETAQQHLQSLQSVGPRGPIKTAPAPAGGARFFETETGGADATKVTLQFGTAALKACTPALVTPL